MIPSNDGDVGNVVASADRIMMKEKADAVAVIVKKKHDDDAGEEPGSNRRCVSCTLLYELCYILTQFYCPSHVGKKRCSGE